MREFGNTPRPGPWYKRLLNWLVRQLTGIGWSPRLTSHDERMRRRRRKTKFDR